MLRTLITSLMLATPLSAGAVALPDTVVLLHGLGRGPWGLKVLEWRLERAGYRVHNIGYDTRSPTIEAAAASVHEQVAACCAEASEIHFVTHSLGGLVLRSLLSEHAVPNAGRAVQLAPPNEGSEIVDLFRGNPLFRFVLGPLAPQLGTRSADVPRSLPPLPIPFGVIAGDRWWNPVGGVLLPSPNDGTVSVESTRHLEMADHLVVPHTHTFIMNSRAVADAIRAFLETGRFAEGRADSR
jgi:triacylglycerol lipase